MSDDLKELRAYNQGKERSTTALNEEKHRARLWFLGWFLKMIGAICVLIVVGTLCASGGYACYMQTNRAPLFTPTCDECNGVGWKACSTCQHACSAVVRGEVVGTIVCPKCNGKGKTNGKLQGEKP